VGASLLDNSVYTVAISGDDSVAAPGPLAKYHGQFGESDMSGFDHSQDEGPMKFGAAKWMAALGVPQEFIHMFYEQASRGYAYGKRQFDGTYLRIRGKSGVQMPTGITTTTVHSSVNAILAYVHVIVNYTTPITEAFAQLGFRAKYAVKESLYDATFIKGWWQLDVDGELGFYPLPSACIKLGKMIKDPCVIAKDRTVKAYGVVANAIAKGLGAIPDDYPVLGAFKQSLLRLSASGRRLVNPNQVIEDYEHKVKHSSSTVDRALVLAAIERRYGLDPADIDRLEKLFLDVKSLPAYVQDEGFNILADTDY
jgi:hypothetical protein